MTLRGKTSDQSGVKSVTVNGIPATTTDQWADWQLKVDPLQNGENLLVVKAENTKGDIKEQIVRVIKQVPMVAPELTALDATHNVFFIYDNNLKGIFTVDMATGTRKVLTQLKSVEDETFTSPTSMVYDSVKDRLILSDYKVTQIESFSASYVGRLVSINARTGERSTFASGAILIDISKPSLSLRKPISLTIDQATRTLYVLDEKAGFIGSQQGQLAFDYAVLKYSLDAETPTFTRVSDNQFNKEEAFVGSKHIRFDGQANQLIAESHFDSLFDSNNQAIESWFGLIAINVTTGARTSISGKNVHTDAKYGFKLLQPADFFIDGGFAYYYDASAIPERVIKINLSTGERSEWFNNIAADNKYNLRALIAMEFDATSKQLYALDDAMDAVFKIDTQNNFKRSPIASNGVINENTALNYISSNAVTWDHAHERLLVTNQLEGTVNAYSLTTGETSLFCNFGILDRTNERVYPIDSVLDGQRLVSLVTYLHVVDGVITTSNRIDSCDLADGKHTIISGEEGTSNLPIYLPTSLAVDSDKQKGYVLTTAIRSTNNINYRENALIQVDLISGERTEYASLETNENPKGSFALNSETGGLFFSVLNNASIYSINSATKKIDLMSSNLTDPSNLLLIPKKIFFNNGQLIALDSGRKSLISIHPDGKRTTLFNITSTGATPINQVGGMLLDSSNQRLFVTDQAIGVLALQDLLTGETIYLAK